MKSTLADDIDDLDVEDGVYYPSEDGQPMAETEIHAEAMILLKQALEDFFENQRDDVYIGLDIFWYWKKGKPKLCRVPDVFVAFGVPDPKRKRRSFRSWRENGAIPAVIFEMASKGTVKENRRDKRKLYEELRVSEYFIFDPEAKYLDAPIEAFRLINGKYQQIVPDEFGHYASEQLGVWLLAKGDELQVVDVATGVAVLTRKKAREAEADRADAERERADAERRKAASEKRRADREKKRADAAEAEIARLKALLQSRQPPPSPT